MADPTGVRVLFAAEQRKTRRKYRTGRPKFAPQNSYFAAQN